MKTKLLVASALVFSAEAQAETIQRQAHDHTIYTVHGSADELAKFQEEVGSQWEGGTLLSKNERKGEYRYWAYSERTAPQAREFMFGSMMSGLRLDIEAYEEERFFPDERSELDSIALKCRFPIDPFFITPKHELRVGPAPSATLQAVECALTEIKASNTLGVLPMGLVGNDALAEEVK